MRLIFERSDRILIKDKILGDEGGEVYTFVLPQSFIQDIKTTLSVLRLRFLPLRQNREFAWNQ